MERTRLAIAAVIVAIIGTLWSVDLFLARIEARETRVEAGHAFNDGLRLLAENHPAEAVDPLRKAYGLDRGDQRFALTLASALIGAGKLDEAQEMLGDILRVSPNNGDANLLEARLSAGRGQVEEAVSYYHRAIYGIWGADDAARRTQVRMELADFLASRGSDKELLAELLPLETEAHDLATRKRVAHLYLVANSPARAAAAYRSLIHDDPRDRSDYAGFGQAELALGDYRAAEMAFQNAGAADRAALAAEIWGLDPTLRRLSTAEKLSRSNRVLELARAALARCQPDGGDLLTSADAMLAQKIRTPTNDLAEERLTLAEQIWDQRNSKCGASTPADEEPLRLVMSKLSGR